MNKAIKTYHVSRARIGPVDPARRARAPAEVQSCVVRLPLPNVAFASLPAFPALHFGLHSPSHSPWTRGICGLTACALGISAGALDGDAEATRHAPIGDSITLIEALDVSHWSGEITDAEVRCWWDQADGAAAFRGSSAQWRSTIPPPGSGRRGRRSRRRAAGSRPRRSAGIWWCSAAKAIPPLRAGLSKRSRRTRPARTRGRP